MIFYFHADEKLTPKQSVRRGANGVFYNPNRAQMDDLKWKLLLQARKIGWEKASINVPLRAKIIATFKRDKGMVRDFELHPKGDIDNFQKFLFDACTGSVFTDDTQIRHLVMLKQWGWDSSYDLWVTNYHEQIEDYETRIHVENANDQEAQ